ncbi:UDP-N-acetylenolpyruvoylglucosamine reductase [Actinobacillus equuli]|nr:UDP-N-acetylenolpyruvoylglucosamine reductase [Actinobacillus equuli]
MQGGENWHELVKWTLANNIAGLENLALIPGVAGSAPIQISVLTGGI